MVDPQRMVVISIASAIVAILILLIYFKFYVKKKINYLFILLIISIPPIVSIFRPGTYESGDLSLHTMRAMSFYNVLFNEHTLPRWAAELNLGYGDTYFEFIYFLPYFIISIFHFIGFTFLDSTKLLLALTYILSGTFMYIWARDEFGKVAGITAAIFYLFTPYHFVDMHFRVTIAENMSFIFLPLVLYVTKRFIENKFKLKYFFFLSISISLFILTHQPTFLAAFPIIVTYAIVKWLKLKKKKIKQVLLYFCSILLGLVYTAFYWLPILFESQYIHQTFVKNEVSYVPFEQLIFSTWRYGFLFQGHKGELSFIVGYTQWLIIILSIYLIYKKRFSQKYRHLLFYFLISFFIYFFMIQSISQPLWKVIPLASNLQFSYRLLVEIAFLTAAIAAVVAKTINKNKIVFIICFITIFYTILNWGNRKSLPDILDTQLKNTLLHGPTITGLYEPTAPQWFDPEKIDMRNRPKHHLEIIEGKGSIVELTRRSTMHEYLISADSQVVLKENTYYFPGWVVLVNNKLHQFTYTDSKFPGIVMLRLKKGTYKVNVVFTDTPIRKYSKWATIASVLITLISCLFIDKKRER